MSRQAEEAATVGLKGAARLCGMLGGLGLATEFGHLELWQLISYVLGGDVVAILLFEAGKLYGAR